MKTGFLAAIAACLCWMGLTAQALAQKEHVAHYKSYNAAIERGDFDAAAASGEAAWRAAETELGDQQTTAILAYNYARLIYYRAPEKAIEPLERVIAVAGDDSSLFVEDPPGLMLAYVRALTSPDSKNANKALRTLLESSDKAEGPLSLLSARGWYHIGMYEMSRNRYASARKGFSSSLTHYIPYKDETPREYAHTLIARGISRVVGSSRNNRDIVDAIRDFGDAIDVFPPQESITAFDPTLATALAWATVTEAAASSDNPGGQQTGSRLTQKPPELPPAERIEWISGRPPLGSCIIDWQRRDPPEFPTYELRQGHLGAVLVGYHIEGTEITDITLLAEVPNKSKFGEIAVESMNEWMLASAPKPECGRNLITAFKFIIE